VLRTALAGDEAWVPELRAGAPSWLSLRENVRGVHPFAALVVVERALPLDHEITMYGAIPTHAQRFSIERVTVTNGTTTTQVSATPVEEPFAPGQFEKLSQDEQLTAPSFEDMRAGVRIGANDLHTGAVSRASLAVDTIEIDPLAPPPAPTRAPFVITDRFVTRANRGIVENALLVPRLAPLVYALASSETLEPAGKFGTYAEMRAARRVAGNALFQVVPKAQTRT
jgi:hypothetical protein